LGTVADGFVSKLRRRYGPGLFHDPTYSVIGAVTLFRSVSSGTGGNRVPRPVYEESERRTYCCRAARSVTRPSPQSAPSRSPSAISCIQITVGRKSHAVIFCSKRFDLLHGCQFIKSQLCECAQSAETSDACHVSTVTSDKMQIFRRPNMEAALNRRGRSHRVILTILHCDN